MFEFVMNNAGGFVALFFCTLLFKPPIRNFAVPLAVAAIVIRLGFAVTPTNELSVALGDTLQVLDKTAGTAGVIGFVVLARQAGRRFVER